jgi:thymidylate synthase (FAD)
MYKMIEVECLDSMGSDLTVVNSARVSFNKRTLSFDTDKERNSKLIKYLSNNKHMSPFGHSFASFYVKAPIFVARQLVKHKFLRWNEVSRRYVDTTPNWYRPEFWRKQTKDKKQGSGSIIEDENIQSQATFYLNDIIADAMSAYSQLLGMGICEEQARMVLPLCHLTEWYWSGSLDAFADMCILRCAEDAQVESRMVADQISNKMKELFPVSWKELMNE